MSTYDGCDGYDQCECHHAEIDRLRLATDMLRAELAEHPTWARMYKTAIEENNRLRAELAEHPTWARMYKTAIEENNRLRAELADRELELDRVSIICDGETDALIDSNIERDKLQQAIARVRELVRHYDPSDPGAAYYSRGDILRALDGGTE